MKIQQGFSQWLMRRGLFLALVWSLAGCVQMTPIPGVARSGDYITLGLGGIVRNVHGEQQLKPEDLQITFTDHLGAVFTLGSSSIFVYKAYPDYASVLNFSAINGNLSSITPAIRPFDGGWFVTLRLVDGDGLPLNCATGLGKVTISSTKLNNTHSPSEGDFTNIPLEILSGSLADPDENFEQQFVGYGAGYISGLPTIDIKPSATLNEPIGGMQLAIKVQSNAVLTSQPPLVLPFSHNPYVQLAQRVVDNGDGTKTINVLVVAQRGFVTTSSQTAETPSLSDLNLQLMYFYGMGSTPDVSTLAGIFSLDASKSFYIDTSGNRKTTPIPVLSVH